MERGGALLTFEHRVDETLSLRLLTSADAKDLAALVRGNLARLSPWLPFATEDYNDQMADGFIQATAKQWASGQGFSAGIILDGQLAGSIGVHELSWNQGHASLGYWVGAEAEGKGVVTRAARALLTWMFDESELERAEIRAATDNLRSRRLAERLGFRLEGVLRHEALLEGRWLDMAVYGLLREDWQQDASRTAKA